MDDDPHLLSLADALTCAFGASIVLFLIFLVLVRFEPPAPIPSSGAQASNSITTSLANDQPGFSSLVILAKSELSVNDCDGSAIQSLEIRKTELDTTRIWSSEQTLWNGAVQTGVLCQKVFEIPNGVTPANQPEIWVDTGNSEIIQFRVHVGAIAWPSWGSFHIESLEAFIPPQGIRLLKVTGNADAPVEKSDR